MSENLTLDTTFGVKDDDLMERLPEILVFAGSGI